MTKLTDWINSIRGKLPEHLHLIGVQPVSLDTGVDLSPQVAAALTQVVERAWGVLAEWGGVRTE
jgi:Ni,Fe-hydrogenase maturation factor